MSAPVLGGRCQSGRSSLGRSIAMCGRTRAAMWRFERTAGWTARGRAPIGLALEHFDRFRQYLRRGAPGAHAYVILIGLETFDPLDLLRVAHERTARPRGGRASGPRQKRGRSPGSRATRRPPRARRVLLTKLRLKPPSNDERSVREP